MSQSFNNQHFCKTNVSIIVQLGSISRKQRKLSFQLIFESDDLRVLYENNN